jgi:hypothetical protein
MSVTVYVYNSNRDRHRYPFLPTTGNVISFFLLIPQLIIVKISKAYNIWFYNITN